jgi:hypothetical protein
MSKERKTPSRVRYENSHPTISCRVSKDIYERLYEIRLEGQSLADIFKVGLRILEPKIQGIQAARREGHEQGYKHGFGEAEERYKVTYICKICNLPIELTTDKEKQCAASYMQEKGWGHVDCHNRSR